MTVNLLIIGAGRSGTTSLSEYLKQHPEVCFSTIKEIPYFSIEDIYRRGENYYHSFFRDIQKPVIASSDTYLLIDHDAPLRIKQYNHAMKFIIMLREPVERAYSSYIYAINNGHQNKKISFARSFELEPENINTKNLVTWMRHFPKENFLLLKTKDLKNNTTRTLKQVSTFLDISDFNDPSEIHINQAAGVQSMFLHRLFIDRDNLMRRFFRSITPDFIKQRIFTSGIIEKIKKINTKKKVYQVLNEEDRKKVMPYFTEDLEKLEKEFHITF